MSHATDAGLQFLESRRLLSGAGVDFLDGATLSLYADPDQAATMAIELDADATHVRGVVNGQAGQWVQTDQVRRVQITGGEGDDSLAIDSRLHRAGATFEFSSVEAVQVRVVLDAKNGGGRTQLAESRQMRDAVMKAAGTVLLSVQSASTTPPTTTAPPTDRPPITSTPPTTPGVTPPRVNPTERPPGTYTPPLTTGAAGSDPRFELYWCLMNTVPDPAYPVSDVGAATLGGHTIGLYPEITDGIARNGGTPIGLDLDAHKAQLALDLAGLTNAPGSLMALDFEVWGPTMPDSGAYYDLAMTQMAQLRPDLSGDQLEAAARAQWQEKAAAFFEASIDVAQATRPDLEWGFYYPQSRHYWGAAYSAEAGDARRAENDLLAATWAKVDWFPASIYWFYPTTEDGDHAAGEGDLENNRRYIADNIAEWIRLAGGPEDDRPVIAMIQPEIHHSNRIHGGSPVPQHDLDLIMSESYRAGAEGLMVWGWVPGNAEGATFAAELNALFAPIAESYNSLIQDIEDEEGV